MRFWPKIRPPAWRRWNIQIPEGTRKPHATTAEADLRLGRSRLQAAGIESAAEDARILFRYVTGWSSSEMILREGDPIEGHLRDRFSEFIERRAKGEPVTRILGQAAFYGRSFIVTEKVLAPRSNSECLVDLALEFLVSDATGHVVDLGTGSGCLLLTLLAERPGLTGTGLDLSEPALAVAQKNAAQLGLVDRTDWIHGDWSDAIGRMRHSCLVISNPPYIRRSVIDQLDGEVRDHDPRLALDGGEDGLDAYRAILDLCANTLPEGATVILETGYDQLASVSALMKARGIIPGANRRDLGGNERAVAASIRKKTLGA